jgi:DNA replication protein DnaC
MLQILAAQEFHDEERLACLCRATRSPTMARSRRRPPAPDLKDELVQLAIDLDLTALAASLPDMLRRAEQEGMAFSAFAHALLHTEVHARRERSLARSLRRSRLGPVEGLEGFNFQIRPQLEPRVVKELLNCRFVEEHRNVLCLGKPGTGKTRIAKAIAHAACLAGHSILSVLCADMLDDLHASQADGTFRRALRRYLKPTLLLIDEFVTVHGVEVAWAVDKVEIPGSNRSLTT